MIKTIHRFCVCLTCLCLLPLNTIQAQGWGSVQGQFILDGELPNENNVLVSKELALCGTDILNESLLVDERTRGIKNIFVYLQKSPQHIHPELQKLSTKPVKITSDGCRFSPHALVAQTEQPIVFSAEDSFMHHVRAVSFSNPPVSQTVVDQSRAEFRFSQVDRFPIRVQCDFHYWMKGWWLVLDHPYATVTDQQGRFEIANLPVGEHIFTVWHERCGYVIRNWKVTVEEDLVTQMQPVLVSADRLKE